MPNSTIFAKLIKDGSLTHLGKLMNRLPLQLAHTRLIYLGYMVGLTYETIIMAACMQSENFWNYSREKLDDLIEYVPQVNSLRSKLDWADGSQSGKSGEGSFHKFPSH